MKKKAWLIPLVAIACAAVINLFFIVNAHISSNSMAPTMESGSFVIGNRLKYVFGEPRQGDVVFFRNEEVSSSLLVKRVIATPGMRFEMKNGRVYINGKLLDEPYVKEFGSDSFDEVTVPDNSYIVLGDNRTESNDARRWKDPFITKDQIKAKATFIWFPKLKSIDTE